MPCQPIRTIINCDFLRNSGTFVFLESYVGQNEETEAALLDQLDGCQTPLVVDADALNILANHRHTLTNLPKGSILTPHPKELERLVGKCQDSYERLTKAIELAHAAKIHIVLKGAYSTIITPTGKCFFNPTGNPGMRYSPRDIRPKSALKSVHSYMDLPVTVPVKS